jgi:superfamily II DNA or RNA helicase/HKD family nuclease
VKLPPGLYETLVTRALDGAVRAEGDSIAADTEALTAESAPHVLGRYLFDALVRALRNLPDEERLAKQVALANQLVALLGAAAPASGIAGNDDGIADPASLLLAIRHAADARLGTGEVPRPSLPLRHSDLLVNGPRDLRLGHELRLELASADAVDILVSFLKWNGVRFIRPELAAFAARHPGRLRVLTTTYMSATEAAAIDALIDLGADVRVSYDARRTRLHAKAWLFHRDSGLSTALVGSSNLSPAAMLDGCEWNVRLSSVDNRTILEKFLATFQQYWEDTDVFEPYDRPRFIEAMRAPRSAALDDLAQAANLRPFPHQQAALDALAIERDRGHHKNLVVAATGTGKTIVAALDYARLRKQHGGDLTLLFVAHRKEILTQSRARYRLAVRDGNFGELLVGGQEPIHGRHVFAAIQALHEKRLRSLAPDAYDVVVIDEFHHAAADTYTALLEHLRPKVLLGLTATPERTDGRSVLHWFDGRIAAELRLWDALDQGLVSPFQYFGIHDGTDLSAVDFASGRYDVASLEKVYTGDHVRANLVLSAIREKIQNPLAMRALGFCVSVAHARFMADFFDKKGLPSVSVDADTPDDERRDALQRLRAGTVNVVFAKDLFNEGVDVPAVDTVLFLRPTESPTVFLQQLGRGLRLEDGKTCLTVLDFIGNAHRKFRFIDRFQAMTRGTRADTRRAIEEGFPHLPSGCDIRLDRESREVVLANVRAAVANVWQEMASDLRRLGDVRLPEFLQRAELTLEELYSNRTRSFAALRHEAGLRHSHADNDVTRAIPRLLHVDDDARLDRFRAWLSSDAPPAADPRDPFQLMLFARLGFARRPVSELAKSFAEVWSQRDLREEVADVLDLVADRQRRPTFEVPGLPFRVHGTYSRHEISAGLRQVRKGKLLSSQGGVFKCEDARADVLYVEIEKNPKDYTPTTLYDDRAISPVLFQWESQAWTRADGKTGLRYQTHAGAGWRILLFVRKRVNDDRGFTSPYLFLGPVRYVSHEGEKPMRIIWGLERAMPPEFFTEVKIAAG